MVAACELFDSTVLRDDERRTVLRFVVAMATSFETIRNYGWICVSRQIHFMHKKCTRWTCLFRKVYITTVFGVYLAVNA